MAQQNPKNDPQKNENIAQPQGTAGIVPNPKDPTQVTDPMLDNGTSYIKGDGEGLLDIGGATTDPGIDPDLPTEAGDMPGNPDANAPDYASKNYDPRELEDGEAITREVGENELVENRLSGLLNSDSKYMQDARRQGLEQANAMGGLGGTVGTGASMTSALRAGLPIASQDAATFAKTASENMGALNQMAQLNHQRATQLEATRMDVQSRADVAALGANAQIAATKLQTAAQRDIAKLDNDTKVLVTNMQGVIQKALALDQFHYNQILNDAQQAAELAKTQMQGEYGLAGTALSKQWDDKIQADINAANARTTYTGEATSIFAGAMDAIAALNGQEMDNEARKGAIGTIMDGARTQYEILNVLYPEQPPLEFDWGSHGG